MIVYSALLSHKQPLKRNCTQQPAVHIEPLAGVWHRAVGEECSNGEQRDTDSLMPPNKITLLQKLPPILYL